MVKLSQDVAWTLDTLVIKVVEIGVGIADAVVEPRTSSFALVVLGHGSATVLVALAISVGPGLSSSVRVSNGISLCNWIGGSLRKNSSDSSKKYEFHFACKGFQYQRQPPFYIKNSTEKAVYSNLAFLTVIFCLLDAY